MPAVVRVKRRIDEEPFNAFILNGKKRRLDTDSGPNTSEEEKDEVSTVLKFAGTVQKQDDATASQIVRLTKEAAKELVTQKARKPVNLTDKARQEMRKSLHENRFRVVNCLRTKVDESEEEISEEITIVDIEKHNECNEKLTDDHETELGVSSDAKPESMGLSDTDTGYVYDLYVPENEQQASNVDFADDNYLSVRAFDNLVYEDHYNDDDDEYDSEDSNQENYFTNDYPDEDDASGKFYSDDEFANDDVEEMCHGVKKFMLDDDDDDDDKFSDCDNSSDDDEDFNVYQDPYTHTVDTTADTFVDDVDFCEVDRNFQSSSKSRILKRLKKDERGENDDDDDDDNNDDDDDDSANGRFYNANEN